MQLTKVLRTETTLYWFSGNEEYGTVSIKTYEESNYFSTSKSTVLQALDNFLCSEYRVASKKIIHLLGELVDVETLVPVFVDSDIYSDIDELECV